MGERIKRYGGPIALMALLASSGLDIPLESARRKTPEEVAAQKLNEERLDARRLFEGADAWHHWEVARKGQKDAERPASAPALRDDTSAPPVKPPPKRRPKKHRPFTPEHFLSPEQGPMIADHPA